ncbi:hypothetical protein C8J57DRAFT_1240152 [Mycena rebaudengoi]|nr:hypothetical protein C8J57DRAFT_1240152 [Mycena rebaudengoi]
MNHRNLAHLLEAERNPRVLAQQLNEPLNLNGDLLGDLLDDRVSYLPYDGGVGLEAMFSAVAGSGPRLANRMLQFNSAHVTWDDDYRPKTFRRNEASRFEPTAPIPVVVKRKGEQAIEGEPPSKRAKGGKAKKTAKVEPTTKLGVKAAKPASARRLRSRNVKTLTKQRSSAVGTACRLFLIYWNLNRVWGSIKLGRSPLQGEIVDTRRDTLEAYRAMDKPQQWMAELAALLARVPNATLAWFRDEASPTARDFWWALTALSSMTSTNSDCVSPEFGENLSQQLNEFICSLSSGCSRSPAQSNLAGGPSSACESARHQVRMKTPL